MLIDGSGAFRELDFCRARSESRLWEESWRVVGFFFFFFLSFFLADSQFPYKRENSFPAANVMSACCLLSMDDV